MASRGWRSGYWVYLVIKLQEQQFQEHILYIKKKVITGYKSNIAKAGRDIK